MKGETNADWRIGEYMKNNILIINEDEKEATELKNRLQSTTPSINPRTMNWMKNCFATARCKRLCLPQ